MLTAVVVSIAVPALAAIGYRTVRNRSPRVAADVRGIALQTVVIIVVLLAIAGAVAGVLVARGGQAVRSLESTPIDVLGRDDCSDLGGTWNTANATCNL